MKHLLYTLLSFSLAALILGCSKDNTDADAPLVPEIEKITIEGINEVHAFPRSSEDLQLVGRITYTDGTSSTTYNELDWESNDTRVLSVHNGLIAPQDNNGTVAISVSYRDKLSSTVDHNITIIGLSDINITSSDLTIDYTTNPPHADINTTGSYTFNANGTFTDMESIEGIGSNITWTSSNTTIATIDYNGLLIVLEKNGTVEINASVFNDINYSVELNITTEP